MEECKYRVKKIEMSKFISSELESDSDLELNSKAESEYDTVLILPTLNKLKT